MRLGLDADCHIISTNNDVDFFEKNKENIKKSIRKSRLYDENLCDSSSKSPRDTQAYILIPEPQTNHNRCLVCRLAYSDY